MNYSTGKFSFILVLAVLLSWGGAWVVARSYRAAMRRLMSAPLAQPPPIPAGGGLGVDFAPLAESAPITAQNNRRAGMRLAMLLVALSALISFSGAALQLHVVMEGMAFSLRRLTVLGIVEMWPVIPALGLLWRWSGWRVLGALALWFGVCWLFAMWQSVEVRPRETLVYLGFEIGPAMLLVAAVCLGGVSRAIAPWLLVPMIGMVWASLAGVDVIALMIDHPPEWFMALVGAIGAVSTMALFALAPWIIAWWPLKQLGKLLAHAYTRKALSELMVLFTAVWGIAQLVISLSAGSDLGLGGAVMLLPLAWIPLVMGIIASMRRSAPGRPPTLLVLRVFQHDKGIQALFDHVIERWRLTGNTVLIAGTDLVLRTLDADDIFTFIDGRLATRFIRSPANVTPRLAEFDMTPDLEGRYRVNECYCHDTTWQQALAALVRRSDVVLMDLRSFKAHNEGCRYELGVLSRTATMRGWSY